MTDIESVRRQFTPDELLQEAKASEMRAMNYWESDPRAKHRELMAASDFALRAAKAYPNTVEYAGNMSEAVVEGLRLLGLGGDEELVVEKGKEMLGYFRGRLTESAEDDVNGMIDFSQSKISAE